MSLLLLLVVVPIGYALLYRILPKGNLLQELVSLPVYWYHIWRSPTDQMTYRRYDYGPHRRQYLLLCEPLPHRTRRPEVIIFYHGGGWIFGSPEQFRLNAHFFVERGYTVFMPSYRRAPLYGYRAVDEDLEASLLLIRRLMDKRAWSDWPMMVSGMSAGGNLAGLLLYDRQRLLRVGLKQAQFSRALFLGAPLDLHQMPPSPPVYWYGGPRQSETFARASPAQHLQASERVPVCWIHGDRDGLVPLRASQAFIERLERVQGRGIWKKLLTGGSHLDAASWIYRDNDLRAFVLEWLVATAPEVSTDRGSQRGGER
ncbi:MAG: alpha/beta hydrolase [Bacteroidota bacterium]